MGNLHHVAETATVAIAGVAAGVACAADVAAARCCCCCCCRDDIAICRYKCTMVHGEHNRYLTLACSDYVHHGEPVQKTIADRHLQHLLLVWSMQ